MSPDLDPDVTSIARRQFSMTRKGFDPDEVRAYLRELADVVDGLRRTVADLRARAQAAETRAAKIEDLDEHRLVELLGEETARILDAGRVASNDIRRKAEEAAERLISEANEEAHRVQAQARGERAAQRAEMLAEVESLRGEAAAELDKRRAEGAELMEEMRLEARAEADEMLDEAQVVRERILGDLVRRRRTAREQLERLNAARERLLAAYDVVRRTVDEATSELTVALPEAKIASDTAARRIHEEPEPSVEELEDLVTMARIAGLLDQSRVTADDDEVAEAAPVQVAPVEIAPVVEVEPPPVVVAVEPGAEEIDVEEEPEDLSDDDGEFATEDDLDDDEFAEVEGEFDEDEIEDEVAEAVAPAANVDALFARLRADAQEEQQGGVAVLSDLDRGDDVEVVSDEDEEQAEDDYYEANEYDHVSEYDDDDASDEGDYADEDDESAMAGAPVAGDDDLVQQRDEALTGVEQELNRRLKRVLADEQNEVLDLLRRTKPAASDDLLPALGAHTARYTEASREELAAAASWGAAAVGGEPDGSCDALSVELAQALVEPLRERIERSFVEATGDLDEINGRLRALYREWKGQRIATAVRHYSVAAYAQGAYGAMADGTPLRWLVDRSSDPCPDADDNALAGAVCKGEAFPTGDHCPPAHLGCRCMVVPAE